MINRLGKYRSAASAPPPAHSTWLCPIPMGFGLFSIGRFHQLFGGGEEDMRLPDMELWDAIRNAWWSDVSVLSDRRGRKIATVQRVQLACFWKSHVLLMNWLSRNCSCSLWNSIISIFRYFGMASRSFPFAFHAFTRLHAQVQAWLLPSSDDLQWFIHLLQTGFQYTADLG